jgi:hypothetical protein
VEPFPLDVAANDAIYGILEELVPNATRPGTTQRTTPQKACLFQQMLIMMKTFT